MSSVPRRPASGADSFQTVSTRRHRPQVLRPGSCNAGLGLWGVVRRGTRVDSRSARLYPDLEPGLCVGGAAGMGGSWLFTEDSGGS